MIDKTVDSFTGDVIKLLSMGDRQERLAIFREVTDEPLCDFIRNGVAISLLPIVEPLPGFIKQVLGRALMDHVDWDAVAEWARTDPEAN